MLGRLLSSLGLTRPPRSVDWSLDENALLKRMEGAIIEQYGHVFLCVPNIVPPELYRACLAYWPHRDQFDRRSPSRRRISLAGLGNASLDREQRDFWHKFGHEIVNCKIKRLLATAFEPYMRRKFDFLPDEKVADIQKNVRYVNYLEDGLNSDSGFTIGPHVDQNYIFVSNIIYMPPNRLQHRMGTMLFEPLDPALRTMDTVYVDEKLVRPVHQFPFLPNTLVSWLQSPVAFHGYTWKKTLWPRRTYQFNVQMDEATVVRAYGADANTNPVYGDYVRKAS